MPAGGAERLGPGGYIIVAPARLSNWPNDLTLAAFCVLSSAPAIVSGTAQVPPYRFAVWNLLDSLGWTVSVAASAYGVGRLATGHHTGHDIAILAIGLGAGAIVAVAATRRHRKRAARRLSAAAAGAPEDPS